LSQSQKILKLLNLREGEGSYIALPMLYSFFAGASLAFFVTAATATFLLDFSREMLPLSFVAAGVFIILTGKGYTFIQKKSTFTGSLLAGQFFLVISVLVLLGIFIVTGSTWTVFILYAWIRIFAYLQGMSFWGLAGRLFSLRQGKRIFGLIAAGEVVATMISFFSVPLLLNSLQTEDLFYISLLMLLCAAIVMTVIAKKFKTQLNDSKQEKVKQTKKEEPKKKIDKKKYLALFAAIAFLPVFAQFFVDFIFQIQAKAEYPSKESLAAFVGIFFGISSIAEFVLKTFFSGRMMNKYGIKFGLSAFPVMLLISILPAAILGTIFGPIGWFFPIIALGRLFTRAVRTSFNDPATQILYQPLPKTERVLFQNKIESGPKAYASIAAGLLLYILVNIEGFSLVHFSYLLLAVIIVWLKTSDNIFIEYKKLLQAILKEAATKKLNKKGIGISILEVLQPLLSTNTQNKHRLNTLRKLFPFIIAKYLYKNDKGVMPEILTLEDATKFAKSENPKERVIAAQVLPYIQRIKARNLLIDLLSDPEESVCREAIIAAGISGKQDYLSQLLYLSEEARYRQLVFKALVEIGKGADSTLEQHFKKAFEKPDIQMMILSVMGTLNDKKSTNFLRSQITNHSKRVAEKATEILSGTGYRCTLLETPFFSEFLELELRSYTYLASCYTDISNKVDAKPFLNILRSEMKRKRNKIFQNLSVLYNPAAITAIQEVLNSSDANAKGFALEIADMEINEKHKNLIAPILDNLSPNDILTRYAEDFPQENLTPVERLQDIIYSGNSVTSLFLKNAAILLLINFEENDGKETLVTTLLHPNKLVSKNAAFVLHFKNKNYYFEQAENLKIKNYKIPEEILENKTITREEALKEILKISLINSHPLFSDTDQNLTAKFLAEAVNTKLKKGASISISNTEAILLLTEGDQDENKLIFSKTDEVIKFSPKEDTQILKFPTYNLSSIIANTYESSLYCANETVRSLTEN